MFRPGEAPTPVGASFVLGHLCPATQHGTLCDVSKDRIWQRSLKGGRQETFVALDGNFLHFKGTSYATQMLLDSLSAATNTPLPPIELRSPTYSRPKPRKPIEGQMTVDDFIQEVECPPASVA